MAEQYNLVRRFLGYNTKAEVTNTKKEFLVQGSQNVEITQDDKIRAIQGYTLFGAANSASNAVESSDDWKNSSGVEINWRAYDDELEIYTDELAAWTRLKNSLTSVNFVQTTWWDAGEIQDVLLLADGTSTLQSWSGGIAAVDITGSTSNTLKLNDATTTWAAKRFHDNSGTVTFDKKLTIGSITYTYTGGEGTNTLTGVTPDPTAGGHSDGDFAIQTITEHANIPVSTFNTDSISVLKNQVYYGDRTDQVVYVSKNTDFTDVTFTSPVRVAGEGAELRLDGVFRAFAPLDSEMYISAGNDSWYQTSFTLTSDGTGETLIVEEAKTAPNQAALSQRAVIKIKNATAFVNNYNEVDFLGRIENIDTPQSQPLSFDIEDELFALDNTNVQLAFWRNKLFVGFPNESKVYIYDFELRLWQAPAIIPFGSWMIKGSDLYFHSNAQPETYKWFDGYNANGLPIESIARFAYRNYGDKFNNKTFHLWATDGYITSNTTLTARLRYNFDGSTSVREHTISGSDADILFSSTTDLGLGNNPLGEQPLGTSTDELSDLQKFKLIKKIVRQDFLEVQVEYSSNETDYRWELIAFGGNVRLSKTKPTKITK